MSGELSVGRIDAALVDGKPTTFDTPNQAIKAVITKLDQVVDKLNEIGAAIEAASDATTLFTQLDTASIKAELKKLRFTL